MGQKIHPTGFRLAVTRNWSSKWYANSKHFAPTLKEDIKIREYLKKKLGHAHEVTLVGSSMPRKLIPHAALLYDAHGDTWVYTNPAPLVFVRQHISVNYIEGDRVVLYAGPPAGTAVVTVGAAELYGAETGVGK